MIPNIVKGGDMPGLLRYLVGRGRANEHTNPHVIGGDGIMQSLYGDELGLRDAARIAAYLDEPRTTYSVEMRTRTHVQDPETGERLETGWKNQHVWHASLSLPPGEVLSEQQWEQVSREFMDGMAFTAESGHAPARWVAIHHGASAGGNDHVHIAASMVREDGTQWAGRFRDWPAAQRVCRDLEERHGLTSVLGGQRGTAERGERPVERAQQQRGGTPTIQRDEVAQRVRSAAVASGTEAEWLRRVRAGGVVVRPRFAEGTTDVVAGYRAALKGQDELRFYGGGQLGRDLSLPRLRELWPAPTLDQAGEASAEWQAAHRGRSSGLVGREQQPLPTTAPDVARRTLAAYADRLAQVPASDRVAWSVAAREVSGALSAWSQVDQQHAAELRGAARVIARTGQDRRPGAGPAQRSAAESAFASALVFAAANGDKPGVAAAALMAQLVRTATALRDMHRQTHNLREAAALDVTVRQLGALDWSGYGAEPRDSRKVEKVRQRQARPARSGPALELPRELEPGPQIAVQYGQERQDRDAGR